MASRFGMKQNAKKIQKNRFKKYIMSKSFYIKTYGCQMNVYDSDVLKDSLISQGWQEADMPENADLAILNTCHIREKAAEKVYSEVGRLRKIKLTRSKMQIAVAGCVAQAEGQEMIARAPAIDFVVGPQAFHLLPEMISHAEAESQKKSSIATEFLTHQKFAHLALGMKRQSSVSAFLTIQEGCDKFCSFCVVPYTRGQEVSRAVADIVQEAEKLAAGGAREIILLGQNVNAFKYRAPDGKIWKLADLLSRLAALPTLHRLRYTTSHPKDMDEALIQAHRDNPKLMPFIHLPVQSGSDRILKKMNRRHDITHYREIIAALRAARADIALSSDFITGFPGETDEDFAATLDLVRQTGFAQAYSFKYSPRPGTPAARAQQIAEPIKRARLAELRALLDQQQMAFHQSLVGCQLDILMERPNMGKSPYGQSVHIKEMHNKGEQDKGEIMSVKIIAAAPHHLTGIAA